MTTRSRRGEMPLGQHVMHAMHSNKSTILKGILIALAALWLMPAVVSAQEVEVRSHQISWSHASPSSVSHFVVLLSTTEGDLSSAREVPVGMPASQTYGNIHVFSAQVAFAENEFLSVAAVGHDGQMSTPSDWGGMPPTRPGQPLLVTP